jgi:hypothetical protein
VCSCELGLGLLGRLSKDQVRMVRSFVLGFVCAALVAVSALALAIGRMNDHQVGEGAGLRHDPQPSSTSKPPAPANSTSLNAGRADLIADPRKAELLQAALEAAGHGAADPVLRAAAVTKYHNDLLTRGACSSESLADIATLCGVPQHSRRATTVRDPADEVNAREYVAHQLDGTWRGDSYSLRVDVERFQANTDPGRPFQWQRCLIRRVSDGKITFSIDAELFEAAFRDDTLVLTSTNFRGERLLHRD